jgi:hypothetical protein
MAEANAIPILGMNFSMAFGQNIMAFVHEHWGFEAAWAVSGGSVSLFIIFFVCAACIALQRQPKQSSLSVQQQKVQLEVGGMDVDKFIDSMCEELREVLLKNKGNLWNAPVQDLVRSRLVAAVPNIRLWNDETNGLEYLEDVRSFLQESPADLSRFWAMFPQTNDPHNQILDVETGAAIPFEDIVRKASSRSVVSPRPSPSSVEEI